MESLVARLEDRVGAHPDAPLYVFLNSAGDPLESYTYREFHERTNHLAARLRSGEVTHGERVLLPYPPGLEFIVAFFACAKLGAIPVPAPLPDRTGQAAGGERLGAIAQDCGARIVLSTDAYSRRLASIAQRDVESPGTRALGTTRRLVWWSTDGSPGRLAAFDSEPGSTLFLQYTSGSTQSPRGVVVSHTNVLHNCDATLDHVPIGVSWLPHFHDMALIGYYLFLMARGGCVYGLSPLSFLKRPLLWLRTMSRFRATATSAPNFAFEYCLREDRIPEREISTLDLTTMRFMANASEPVRPHTQERFLARFGRCGLDRAALFSFYGLAENTLSVTGEGRASVHVNSSLLTRGLVRLETPRPKLAGQTRLASCGPPRLGVDVRIVEPRTREALTEGTIGEIWVTGESKAEGYWGSPELSREVLDARLEGDEAGIPYLRTGDRGFFHEGELYVCGRLKDLIIVGGRNFYANDIEAAVEQFSELVRPDGVAAFAVDSEDGEKLVILVEPKRLSELPDPDAIWREVCRRCQIEAGVVSIVPHRAIVRTSSGKMARRATSREWAAGQVQTLLRTDQVISPAGDPIADLLRRLTSATDDSATLAELGVDSLTLVELSLHL